jgi:hypothetical protein
LPPGQLFVPALDVRGALGGMPKTTAKIFKKHAVLAGCTTGYDPMLLHWSRLQKLSIMFQVLNVKLFALCMPYGDEYHTRPPTQNAGALFSSGGAAVADGKPPTVSSSERAGIDIIYERRPLFRRNFRLFESYKE